MTLSIHPARTDADFAALHGLRQRMALWDVAMSQADGDAAEDILTAYYAAGPAEMRAVFGRPGAGVFLARSGFNTIGSLGFSRHDASTAELQLFYVADESRGMGTGRALIAKVLARLTAQSYRRAVLETAHFMTAAIALYRASGFQTCTPFRPTPPGVTIPSVFMNRDLSPDAPLGGSRNRG